MKGNFSSSSPSSPLRREEREQPPGRPTASASAAGQWTGRPTPATPAERISARYTVTGDTATTMTEHAPSSHSDDEISGEGVRQENTDEGTQSQQHQTQQENPGEETTQSQQRPLGSRLSDLIGTTLTVPTEPRRQGYRLSTEQHPDHMMMEEEGKDDY